MKKLFSLFTLLVAIVMGAWADVATIDGTNLNVTGGAKTVDDIQLSVPSSNGFGYNNGLNAGGSGKTFILTPLNGANITQVVITMKEKSNRFTTSNITNCTSATRSDNVYTCVISDGSVAISFKNNGGGVTITKLEVTYTSAGPVDPVFELSAEEVEVGKTISVTGPDGLTFNAEPVSGTTGEVSVSDGTITGVTAGAAQVRVTSAATDDYNAYDNTFDITVTAAKIATELSFGTPTTTVARGEEVTNAATLTAGGEAISGTVTYSSDNEAVATVDATGKVTGVKVGTANIKANFAGDATYSAAEEVSYAITVTLPALTAVDNKFWTSASLLSEAGGAKDYTTADVLDNMEIAGTSTALKITTGGEKTIDGQTFGGRVRFGKDGTAEGNYLHFMVKPNTKITMWGIRATAGAESDGLALSIGAVGNEEEVYSFAGGDVEYMTYIYTGSEDADMYAYSKATAGASMMAIKVEPIQSTTINLNASGFATYSSKYDFTFEGAQAYKMALDEGAKTLTGTEVTGKIKAGEGILFKGDANAEVTITEAAGATALDGNSLVGSTQADGTTAEKPENCYALSGDTFKKFTGDALVANKAFFATTSALAVDFDIVFDEGEATAVEAIAEADEAKAAPVKVIKNGKLYIGNFNVAGQQVK